jgi:hypothetical protein
MRLQFFFARRFGCNGLLRGLVLTLLICATTEAALAQPGGRRLAVILEGTALGVPAEVPDINGDGRPDAATCWDLNMVDAKTATHIGRAIDCLSFVDLDGTGPKPVGTTFFRFPQGMLVSRGKNTAQPVLWDPSINPDVDPNVTLVTGAFPAPDSNNVLSGTHEFAKARGRVRFSGAVRIHPDNVTVTFSCIFIIDLDRPNEDRDKRGE